MGHSRVQRWQDLGPQATAEHCTDCSVTAPMCPSTRCTPPAHDMHTSLRCSTGLPTLAQVDPADLRQCGEMLPDSLSPPQNAIVAAVFAVRGTENYTCM